MQAPERIFGRMTNGTDILVPCFASDVMAVEYIRADITAARIAALEAQVAAADRLAGAAKGLAAETWRFDHSEATPDLADAYVKAVTPYEDKVHAALAAYRASRGGDK